MGIFLRWLWYGCPCDSSDCNMRSFGPLLWSCNNWAAQGLHQTPPSFPRRRYGLALFVRDQLRAVSRGGRQVSGVALGLGIFVDFWQCALASVRLRGRLSAESAGQLKPRKARVSNIAREMMTRQEQLQHYQKCSMELT